MTPLVKNLKAPLPAELVAEFDRLRGATARIRALRILMRLAEHDSVVREKFRDALLRPEEP